MNYHKIDSVYKRDPATKNKSFLIGQFARPEFDYLALNEWVGTEKVDGTNIRIAPGYIAGRTDDAQISAKLYPTLIDIQGRLGNWVERNPGSSDITLYGEGYGAGIQSGGNYRPDQSFILFDIRIGNIWLERHNVHDIAVQLDLAAVPVLGIHPLLIWVEKINNGDYYQSRFSEGFNEGVVLRPKVEMLDRRCERIITKLKYKDFAANRNGGK